MGIWVHGKKGGERLIYEVWFRMKRASEIHAEMQVIDDSRRDSMLLLRENPENKLWKIARTYPSIVRQMLMKRSAPQPAIMKTPTGGTILNVSRKKKLGRLALDKHTEDGDDNDQDRGYGV